MKKMKKNRREKVDFIEIKVDFIEKKVGKMKKKKIKHGPITLPYHVLPLLFNCLVGD